jgi:hypothetical protein
MGDLKTDTIRISLSGDWSQSLRSVARTQRRRRSMEKGDIFVLLSLILLALIFLIPFYRGRDLGSRERAALDVLMATRQEAIASGLVNELETIGEAVSALQGLRPQSDAPEILPGGDAPILWRDGAYDYAIRFLGFQGGRFRDSRFTDRGPVLVVNPDKPGETGTKRFHWFPGKELQMEEIHGVELKGDPEYMLNAARKAKRLAKRIVQILSDSKLEKLCLALCAALPKNLQPIAELKFGSLSPMWTDGNYLFRISIAMTPIGLDLDLWSWPRIRGSKGFDAFFASGRSIPAQSWNMSSPYDGLEDLKSIPRPGTARDRSGLKLGSKDNWVGWDGKRWFALEIYY